MVVDSFEICVLLEGIFADMHFFKYQHSTATFRVRCAWLKQVALLLFLLRLCLRKYLASHGVKRLLDSNIQLGARLKKLNVVFLGQLDTLFFCHTTIFNIGIALVAQQHAYNVRRSMFTDLLHPSSNTVKGLFTVNVVHQENAHGTSIVRSGNGAKPLLTGRVPYLHLDSLSVNVQRFDLEIDADG